MALHYLAAAILASFSGLVLAVALALLRVKKEKQRQDDTAPVIKAKADAHHRSCAEVIIVGAGVAGSALAYKLGKDGRQVHVLERDLSKPNRIVGETLQPAGYLKLIELGLEDCVEEIDAQLLFGYTLFKDGKFTELSYPLKSHPSNVAGRCFHNGRFVQRIREKAASLPKVKLEQGTVTSLIEENGTVKGVSYKTKAGDEMQAFAPLTIVCDGSLSKLRGSLCTPKVDMHSFFIGLVLENIQLPSPNYINIVLGDHSFVIFYQISRTEVRCMIDLPGQRFPSIANGEMANYLKTIVAPQIPGELNDAFLSAIDRGRIKVVPTRSMPASPNPIPGSLLLGDALNMRHPVTGTGMTAALCDVALLSNLLMPLNHLHDASSLNLHVESFYILRKPAVSIMNITADCLYKIFTSLPMNTRKEMERACFYYVSRSGLFSDGPMALLSGLDTNILRLCIHFLGFAIYAVGHLMLPFPSLKRLCIVAQLIFSSFQGLKTRFRDRDRPSEIGIGIGRIGRIGSFGIGIVR